jgi:tripartite-type tricarboxylate transporter receptor subunit TctC
VPTFKEQGVPGLEVIGWAGVFAPSGVPVPLIEQISTAMQQALKEPTVNEQFMRLGFAAAGNTPAQFSQLFDEDEARWTALAQIAGLKPE